MTTILLSFLVVVAISVLSALYYFYSKQRDQSTKGLAKFLPYTQPSDSNLGDLKEALKVGSLRDYFMKKHEGGRISLNCFWWRDKQVVSVCGPKAFKDTEQLTNRPEHVLGAFSNPLYGPKSIQNINGTEWEERKKTVHGTLRGSNIEKYYEVILEVSEEAVAKWTPGEKISLKKEFFRASLKAVLNTTLGTVFNNDDELDELAATYDRCKNEMDRRILDIPLPDSEREITFQKNRAELYTSMRKILQLQKENGNIKSFPPMDSLLASGLPDDHIISDMITIMGGFHTMALFLIWLTDYLAQHEAIQEKIVRDMTEYVKKESGLKKYCLSSSTYLRQVVDEALRMSTTALFTFHHSDDDLVVEGHHVPANTTIFQAVGVTMMDEAIWNDPSTFNPDRFAPGSDYSKRKHEFRPFGVSLSRRCPANQFAYAMASIFLSVLLQRFVVITTKEPGEDEKSYGLTAYPKGNITVKVQYRQ